MPRQSLQLNDFSGGLNTKSSPRDIAPNQVQSTSNAVFSTPGIIYSSSSATAKSASVGATGAIDDIEVRNFVNTAFHFNTQYDLNATSGARGAWQGSPREVITLHETISTAPEITYLTRSFGTTGNFTRTVNNKISGIHKPIYYYVDGVLYVADESHTNAFDISYAARQSLRFLDTNRFGVSTLKWLSGAATLGTTADANANIADADSFSATLNVDGEFEMIYDIEDSSGGGAWEAGAYEWSYTYVDLTDDETLPHIWSSAPSAASLSAGHFFTAVGVKINVANAFREKEKGFRIYIRRKDKNERWNLFLDADYERGLRTNLFDDFTAWGGSGTYKSSGTKEITGIEIQSPSLDTYDSINGFSHTEKSIDVDGYIDACIAQRRAWTCNVAKESKVFDDRIYFSPVNRFNTFPDSYYLDIGINDGDSFRAIESFGNRIIAFKKSKIYVINISSTSDAGWYLEAEYDGHGCDKKEVVCKTPYGICWANTDGIFLFDGQSSPREITENLSDAEWITAIATGVASSDGSAGVIFNNASIAYNQKYKQLYVSLNLSSTSAKNIYVYDFAKKAWSILNRGATVQSNFVETSDGIYAYEFTENAHADSTGEDVTVKKYELLDLGTNTITVKTKDLDFGNPGFVKKVKRVFITCRDNGEDTDLALKYYNDGKSSTHTGSLAAQQINSANYKVLEFTIASGDRNCESMAFELISSDGGGTSGAKIEINDINIDYRPTNKRPS
tara:strand:+ start:196 stop:2394 length:2199 start_codon:yes stop_codon:yes gene_type:complete